MRANDLCFVGGKAVHNSLPKATMLLHDLVLFRRQLSRLEQNRVGDADLADVMELGRGFEYIERGRCQPQFIADDAGISSDPQDMLARVIIAKLRRAGQTLN